MTFTAQMRLIITLSVLGMLAVVGIVSYAAGASNERAVPLSERVLTECEAVEAGSDLGPILEDAGYNLEFLGNNIAGSPRYVAWSPGCKEQF